MLRPLRFYLAEIFVRGVPAGMIIALGGALPPLRGVAKLPNEIKTRLITRSGSVDALLRRAKGEPR